MEGELTQRVIPPQPGDVIRPRVSPLSATRYAVQFTMDAASHELLERAQALLGHRVAPGDIADVLGRALRAYVALLERAKFAATSRPHAHPRRTGKDSRHIPAHVQRAVWERDGGQCTFIGDSGHRCEERADLEFDHVQEYACDGEASVGSIRLLCRAHNQFEAEKAFGFEFMRHKREKALAARSARSA
jgi:5-methylcytosine-specific restriction endonuclease McrA